MKGIITILFFAGLVGCATQGVDSSFANENGVYDESVATLASVIEGRDYCNKVSPVSSRPFQSAKESELPENLVAEEIWVVEQCGVRKEYQLAFTRKVNGEVIVGVKLHR